MGHEFIGVVESIGTDVRTVKKGDLVVAPFAWSDGTCEFCQQGLKTSCLHGGWWDGTALDGGQGEAVRVTQADGTLVALPVGPDHALMPSLLTLSDVICTGHHAAPRANVRPGKVAAVVGDGAVGLCGVIAARRLGAEQIIMLGRHPDRIALARKFGATDVVSERGDAASERVTGADQWTRRSLRPRVRWPRRVDAHGREHCARGRCRRPRPGASRTTLPNAQPTFYANITIAGGPAPVRAYMHELMPDVWKAESSGPRVRPHHEDRRRPRWLSCDEDREAIKVMIEF